ncbi:hypothetical protein IJN73_01145 [Candidatus Saccharibacteria bacterium]|nr:hypothetical protein [Candidatus Saccharibacteria bacterium]MBQ7040658.1 hypothetical protein [Candidatus Saccharibacteria bacterium]
MTINAKVMKANNKTVVVKTKSGKFLTVKRSDIDFDVKAGTTLSIEKNGNELYFLPESSSFWDDDSDMISEECDGLTVVALISAIMLAVSNICTIVMVINHAGIIPLGISLSSGALFMVVSCICRNFAKGRDTNAYKIAKNVLWVFLACYIFVLVYVLIAIAYLDYASKV